MNDGNWIEGSISISTADLERDLARAGKAMDAAADKMARSAEAAAKRQEAASKRAADKAARDAEVMARATEKAADRVARAAEQSAARQSAAAERAAKAQERQADAMARKAAAAEQSAAIAAERASERKIAAAAKAAAADQRAYDQQLRAAQKAAAGRAWDAQSVGGGRAGRGPGGAQGMLTVGRFIDDLQYVPQQGLRPIANQLVELAPKLGIVAIGLSVMGSAAKAAFSALRDAGGGEAASDLDKLRERVERLRNVWIQTSDSIREANQARMDLANAEKAGEVREVRSEKSREAAKAFETATARAGGGNAVDSVVRQLASEEYASNDVAAVQRALQTGRISSETAASVGLSAESTPREILRALEAPEHRAALRSEVVDARTNEIMAGLANGDPGAAENLFGMARGSRLGARDASGAYTNSFLRDLAAGGDSDKASEEARKESERKDSEAKSEREKQGREKERAERELEGKAAPFVSAMQERYTRSAASGSSIGREDVARAMTDAGASPADVAELSGSVHKGLREGFQTAVRDRALAENISPEAATKAIDADFDAKAEMEEERRRADAVKAAEEARPSIGKQAGNMYFDALASSPMGTSPDAVGKRVAEGLERQLLASGLGADQAKLAAATLTEEARADAERTLANGVFSGRREMMEQRPRGPEIFDASDLWRRVAVGVGGTDADKQLNVLNLLLRAIQDQTRVIGENDNGLAELG